MALSGLQFDEGTPDFASPYFDDRFLLFLAVLLDLALHATPDPVSKKSIAQRVGVPARSLDRIMQSLVSSRLAHASRGPQGGYVLARERRLVSVADIVSVSQTDQPEDPATSGNVSPYYESIISPLRKNVSEHIMKYLAQISLQDLCDQARHKNVVMREPSDFSI